MSYLTKYGTLWGDIPETQGRLFWVSPGATTVVDGRTFSASDNNDGLSPERPLRTVNYAWSLTTANSGDVVILMPGAHSVQNSSGVATSLAANVAGVKMVGLNRNKAGGHSNPLYKAVSLTCAANDETVNVTAANIEIAGITFLGDALNTGSALLNFSALATNLYIHDCTIDVTAQTASPSILGFDATGAAAFVCIQNVYSACDGAFGAMIDMTATVDGLIQEYTHVQQTGTLAACITVGAGTDRLHIRRCTIIDHAGTVTAGVDGTGATVANGCAVYDCRFGVGVAVPIDGFDAAECMISENYDFGIGVADGGALITAIT